MTLNNVIAVILRYYPECITTERWLRQTSYSYTHTTPILFATCSPKSLVFSNPPIYYLWRYRQKIRRMSALTRGSPLIKANLNNTAG